MSDTLVLNIPGDGDIHVLLQGQRLETTSAVAQALEKILDNRPGLIVAIEAEESAHYEAIGMAIYGSTRAGFSGERLRVTLGGKPLLNGEDNETR